MGHWNHRVMRHRAGTEDEYLAIHEVYYDNKEETKNVGWTDEPARIMGESVDDLRQILTWMLKSLDKPIMKYED